MRHRSLATGWAGLNKSPAKNLGEMGDLGFRVIIGGKLKLGGDHLSCIMEPETR